MLRSPDLPKSTAALDFALAALRAGDVAGAELRLRDILFADRPHGTHGRYGWQPDAFSGILAGDGWLSSRSRRRT